MKRKLALSLLALFLLAAPRIGRFAEAHLLALDLLLPGWAPSLNEVTRSGIDYGDAVWDLYRSGGQQRGGFVLVPGLSREGKDHPVFRRMASSLARAGFLVLAPDFPDLRAFHVSEAGVKTIVEAIHLLKAHDISSIGILGFSFGAGPALIAAADPSIREHVDLVGSFGGYWDLAGVIAFVTTGWHEENGRWRHTAQQPYNRWKLLAALAPFVEDPAERALLQDLVARKLANPDEEVSAELRRLGAEGRQLFALVDNRQRDRVADLLASLSPKISERIQALSPSAGIGRVKARLLVAHGRDDDSIPYTESVRLARAAPDLGNLVIFEGLAHAFPSEGVWRTRLRQVRDFKRLVLLLDALLTTRRALATPSKD